MARHAGMVKLAGTILCAMLATGCGVIGTGEHLLIKADANKDDIKELKDVFSHLLVDDSSAATRFVALTPGASVDPQAYNDYLIKKYGRKDFTAAVLNATLRNRNATPTFTPIDLSTILTGKITDLLLKTVSLSA